MPSLDDPLVGRAAERERLGRAWDDAQRGAGGVWLVLGEAGIGKSRLVEQLAEDARAVWGRSWEAGGAPPFWPWVQALRALRRAGFAPSDAEGLAPLLPELAPEGRPTLPPDDARFRLLDGAVRALCEASADAPLLVVLEDMHAADAPSLELLGLLADAARTAPLLVVASARENELRERHRTALEGLERRTHVLRLGPLTEAEVTEYARATLGDAPTDALFQVTEGHPLFLVEAVRLRRAHGTDAAQVPPNVFAALEGRLRAFGDGAHTLERASVLGREIELAQLAALVDDVGEARRDLEAAQRADLVARVGPERWRFGHILLREVAYRALPSETRRALHRKAAEALEASEPTPWSDVARHLRHARSPRFADAAHAAAREALAQLAFEDARELLEDAVAADRRREALNGERLLALAEAQLLIGDVPNGRQTCLEVADLARRERAPELLCRAALAYGSVFVVAAVDHHLANLLEEALEALGEGDHPLRARALARLAAALQPAPSPDKPFALAREAVAMARRLGDRRGLLATIRAASSAMMDLADPQERLALNREQVALARELSDRVEQWRGHTRSVFDAAELGDLQTLTTNIDAACEIARELDLPHYLWSAMALRAMVEDFHGRFDAAEALAREALAVADRARDPNASRTLSIQRIVRLQARGDWMPMRAELANLRALCKGSPFGESLVRTFEAALDLRLTGTGEVDDEFVEQALMLGDRSMVTLVGDAVARLGDRDLAVRVEARLAPYARHYTSFGVFGHCLGMPVARMIGTLAVSLGRRDDAIASYEDALSLARSLDARPQVAWCALELSRLVQGERRERLREEAHALADELGLPGVLDELAEDLDEPTEAPARSSEVTLRRDGEIWQLGFEGRALRLRDTKGVRMLAALLAQPGREMHVLDLAADGKTAAPKSDAGEVIDAQARDAYAARVRALRAQLDDAQSDGDIGRAERARTELTFLERELAAAYGLGGRERRAGSNAEKARVNVRRRLKDALERVREQDAAAGKHLERRLRTGMFCVYEP